MYKINKQKCSLINMICGKKIVQFSKKTCQICEIKTMCLLEYIVYLI